jgi:hypothetical protein
MKKVIWAIDIPATPHIYDKLKDSLGENVQVIGVGPLEKAEEILKLVEEHHAEEVVTAIEDPCEMHKLLSGGIEPIVAIIEEIATCKTESECKEYEDKGYIVIKSDEGLSVLEVKEFARVVDIMFELAEPGEVHEHEH